MDMPEMRAYGHIWKHYRITRTERTIPFRSGHGILVPQNMDYATDYIEQENGPKVNVFWSLYSKHSKGTVLPFPKELYLPLIRVQAYDDKIYLHITPQTSQLFSDCRKMYIEGKSDLVINQGNVYEYLGEFDPATKRFIVDRVLPIPATSKMDSEYRRLFNGNPDIDISVMVEKSEKYVCE